MYRPTHITGFFGALILMLCIQTSQAGSATWKRNARSGDWNTKTNWRPATVPNGSADTATFALSNMTNVSISANTAVNGITFSAAATNPYTIATSPTFTLTISGMGITNNSGVTQNFVANFKSISNTPSIEFTNRATAGIETAFTNNSGEIFFLNSSTAGAATITNNGPRSAADKAA